MSEPKPKYDTCGYVEVRGAAGELLFRFDARRDLIEIKPKNGRKQVVDLRPLRSGCDFVFMSLDNEED